LGNFPLAGCSFSCADTRSEFCGHYAKVPGNWIIRGHGHLRDGVWLCEVGWPCFSSLSLFFVFNGEMRCSQFDEFFTNSILRQIGQHFFLFFLGLSFALSRVRRSGLVYLILAYRYI